MRTSELIQSLRRSGYRVYKTETGLKVDGIDVIHNDLTGVSQVGHSKFRAKDPYSFMNFLSEEATLHFTSHQKKQLSFKNKLNI